ncbi:MAG TPA: glycoside hydrolase family 18 protein [Candidatus Limnocylindrales bacterium]
MTASRRPMAGPPRRISVAARARSAARTPRGRAALALVAVASIVASALTIRSAGAAPTPARASAAAGGGTIAAVPGSVRPVPGHEMYAFVPYWEMDASIARHVASVRLTTVGLFSVTHGSTGALAAKEPGYRRITGPIGRQIVADAHRDGRRVEVAYASFGREKNDALFASDRVQAAVIRGLVALRRTLDVDGVAVDVEDIDPLDIPAYGAFVGRLRAALRSDDADATVTAATGAGPGGAALAAAANLAGADRIFLMGYDYRTGASEPGASAPLARLDGDQRTLAWSLDAYAVAGIPSTRLILGLPLYGVAWPVDSPDLGAPATGKGSVWIPRRNLASLHDRTLHPTVDPVEQVAFLAVPDGSAWQAVYYDTPETLTEKLLLADDRGLAGAGVWALGYERGLPGYAKVLATFGAGRLTTSSSP